MAAILILAFSPQGTMTKPPHDASTVEEGERYLGLENVSLTGAACICLLWTKVDLFIPGACDSSGTHGKNEK
jgi:hypothetical protein